MNRLAETMIAGFRVSPLGGLRAYEPWQLTRAAEAVVRDLIAALSNDYHMEDGVAVHASAQVEAGAVVKGPTIIGPDCLIAAGAYLRGGCWCEAACVVGPGCELKSSFLFSGAKLAHFNFVGDSILGRSANLEAGAVIANHRNEDEEPEPVVLMHEGRRIETGVVKFGALVGDRVRIGANAVVAPGAILAPGSTIGRLALIDQRETARNPQAGSRPSGV